MKKVSLAVAALLLVAATAVAQEDFSPEDQGVDLDAYSPSISKMSAPRIPLPNIRRSGSYGSAVSGGSSSSRNAPTVDYDPTSAFIAEGTRTEQAAETLSSRQTQELPAIGQTLSGQGRALDGSNLVVGGMPVHLHGMEAPSLHQMCRTSKGTEWPCGRKAFQRLSQLVNQQQVTCTVTMEAPPGVAARCSTPGAGDISRLMVMEGWAAVPALVAADYRREETVAVAEGRGIWSGSLVLPWDWRQQANRLGSR